MPACLRMLTLTSCFKNRSDESTTLSAWHWANKEQEKLTGFGQPIRPSACASHDNDVMSLPNSLQSIKDLPDKSWLHEIDLYERVVSFQISSDFKPHSNALPCLHRNHLACIHGRLVMSLHAVAAQVGAVKGGDGAHHMGHPEPCRRVDIQEALNALPPHEGTCQTSPRQLVKPCSIDGCSGKETLRC